MNSRTIAQLLTYTGVFLVLQVLVTRNLALFHWAYCYAYVGAILLLPLSLNRIGVLLMGFVFGLVMDLFYGTPGMHAAALTAVAWARSVSLKLLTPPGGYEEWMEVSIGSMGPRWYFQFVLPLVFLHNGVLLLIEYADFSQILTVLGKALASTALSMAVILLIQFAINRPSTRL